MHLCKDSLGQEYLFKPALSKRAREYEPFRADVQIAAARLQQIISPDTAVRCELVEIDDLKGTIQPKIKIDEEKTDSLRRYYLGNGTLDENIARQFMREFVVDYCLINYDSHYKNFIVDEKGNLRGVDKEQSLKHINDEEINGDMRFDKYHPNARYGEVPPIYGKIFADIEDGKLSPQILEEVKIGIERIRKIPRSEYIDIFTPYAESLGYKDIKLATFYHQIMDRLDSLSEVEKMIEDMVKPKNKTPLTNLSKKSKDLKRQLKDKEVSRGKQRKIENQKKGENKSEI